MIKIKVVREPITELDPETGQMVERIICEPETPMFPLSIYYPTAVRAESDGEFWRIYELGDM